MALKMAFAGFRHAHIYSAYDMAAKRDDVEIVGACEEDSRARAALPESISITHTNISAMLDEVECDVVAVGDYYARRGGIIIEALKCGKHVIADKPICTSLAELDEIESLAGENGLVVGCQLDMRDTGNFLCMRELVRGGEIGEVHAVSFGGQHPLMLGSRPEWYFEEGKHGGTINDIAIHAVDCIPWITGHEITEINAARSWNALAKDFPHFHDAGQVMMTLDNGCGVLGDVSYFSPDSFGYTLPLYWRMNMWGEGGVLETASAMDGVTLYKAGEAEARKVPPVDSHGGQFLDSFLSEVGGRKDGLHISSAEVLRSSRLALTAQAMALQAGKGANLLE